MERLKYFCVYCNLIKTRKSGIHCGKQTCYCNNCRKTFYPNENLFAIVEGRIKTTVKERKPRLVSDYVKPPCPYCNGLDTRKHGTQEGKQYYVCRTCKKYFTLKTKINPLKIKPLRIYLRDEYKPTDDGRKLCRICREYKTLNCFSSDSHYKYGYNNTCRKCINDKGYNQTIRFKKYGITILDYEKMLSDQGGICVICKIPLDNGDENKGHIDHDHKTMYIRGVLCHACNKILGFARDNTEILERAILYLKNPQN